MIIYRTKIGNIISEFSLALGKPKGVVIICDGLPGRAGNKDLMAKINSLGFHAFYPRYGGTWESSGKFLSVSPAADIKVVVGKIMGSPIKELYSDKELDFRGLPINLLGGSFGGTVALAMVNDKNIFKIIAMSPIVDFKGHNFEGNEQDLMWLMKFMKKAFGRAYDFTEADWRKMMRGKLFNPVQNIDKKRAKDVIIFYDKQDASIDWKKVSDYANRNAIKTVATDGLGHISFSKITDQQWKIIQKLFDSK